MNFSCRQQDMLNFPPYSVTNTIHVNEGCDHYYVIGNIPVICDVVDAQLLIHGNQPNCHSQLHNNGHTHRICP